MAGLLSATAGARTRCGSHEDARGPRWGKVTKTNHKGRRKLDQGYCLGNLYPISSLARHLRRPRSGHLRHDDSVLRPTSPRPSFPRATGGEVRSTPRDEDAAEEAGVKDGQLAAREQVGERQAVEGPDSRRLAGSR